jgi:hypothetical protein
MSCSANRVRIAFFVIFVIFVVETLLCSLQFLASLRDFFAPLRETSYPTLPARFTAPPLYTGRSLSALLVS